MIFNLNKILKLIKRNTEFIFLLLLVLVTITSTTFYNDKKKFINENYIDIINNIYFQKSIEHIFDNLNPRDWPSPKVLPVSPEPMFVSPIWILNGALSPLRP